MEMAKKNAKSKASDSYQFDPRTKAVMAAAPNSKQAEVKSQVARVREVVPGRSVNEVVLVLQYYDYDVEGAIQAYLEDGAKEALEEWHYPENKPSKKKRHKRKKAPETVPPSSDTAVNNSFPLSNSSSAYKQETDIKSSVQSQSLQTQQPSSFSSSSNHLPAQDVSTGQSAPSVSAASAFSTGGHFVSVNSSGFAPKQGAPHADQKLSDSPASKPKVENSIFTPSRKPQDTKTREKQPVKDIKPKSLPIRDVTSDHNDHRKDPPEVIASHVSEVVAAMAQRPRTTSERKGASSGLEKSLKDLQRQTSSLQRLKSVMSEDCDRSYKNIKEVFEVLRNELNNREAMLMFDMDKANQQAAEILTMRQKQATELKARTHRAPSLNDAELQELKADIKHFVSERKIDEEVSRCTKLQCDSADLVAAIQRLGEVSAIRHLYTRRGSSASQTSSVTTQLESSSSFTPAVTPAEDRPPVSTGPMTVVSSSISPKRLAELQEELRHSLKEQQSNKIAQKQIDKSRKERRNEEFKDDVDGEKSRNARRRMKNRQRRSQDLEDDVIGADGDNNEAKPHARESPSRGAARGSPTRARGGARGGGGRGQRQTSPGKGGGRGRGGWAYRQGGYEAGRREYGGEAGRKGDGYYNRGSSGGRKGPNDNYRKKPNHHSPEKQKTDKAVAKAAAEDEVKEAANEKEQKPVEAKDENMNHAIPNGYSAEHGPKPQREPRLPAKKAEVHVTTDTENKMATVNGCNAGEEN